MGYEGGSVMTIYLDMDGVIADFFSEFAKRNNVEHWKSIKDKEKALVDLRYTDYFYQIDCFEPWNIPNNSQRVVNFVKSKGDWGICSSPLRGDEYNSAYWKRLWLEKWDFMPEVGNCIFTHNKHHYAINKLTGKPNILVDDKIRNIAAWDKAGGIGIRFQNDEDDIETYLFPKIEEALETVGQHNSIYF